MDAPEFRADTDKSKLLVAPISGEEIEQAIRDLLAMPDSVKAALKQIGQSRS